MADHSKSSPYNIRSRPIHHQDEAIRVLVEKGERELAEKREARAQARKIRLQKLKEEQDKEDEIDSGGVGGGGGTSGISSTAGSTASLSRRSRRVENGIASSSTTDSTQEEDLEKKFKELNVANASLSNEKEKLKAQVDQLKDMIADLEEFNQESREDVRAKTKTIAQRNLLLERQLAEIEEQRQQILHRDRYLESKGLLLPSMDRDGAGEGDSEQMEDDLIGQSEKVKELQEQIHQTQDENRHLTKDRDRLRKELDSLREAMSAMEKNDSLFNGPNYRDQLRDSLKQVSEYKQKWQLVDGDKSRLEAQIQRFELMTKRLRKQVEDLEKNEEELKSKNRKSARELRQAQTEIGQLREDNEHLQKRIDTLRKAKRFGGGQD